MDTFCQRYPQMCLEQQHYDYIKSLGSLRHPDRTPNKNVIPNKYVNDGKGNSSTKDKVKLATDSIIEKLKTRRVGKLTNSFPPKLEELMRGVSGRPVKGWALELEGQEFNIYINETLKQMRINFRGARGSPNVINIIKNKPIHGTDVTQEREILKELQLKNGKAEIDGVEYSVTLVGHSYGGYKARLYGAETNTPAEIFGGHIMPYNKFPKTEAKVNYHTIINDPVDFKFLEKLDSNVSHTYYQPLTAESQVLSAQIVGASTEPSILNSHYAKAWEDLDRETQFSIIADLKTKYPELGIGIVALAPSIYASATDPNYDPKTDPLLGGATELGFLGVNIDPNYEWSDISPPTGGLDWLIWKSLHPLTEAIASPSNPMKALEKDQNIEKIANKNDVPVSTFTYNGEEYYYKKDTDNKTIWFSVNGVPLSQEIKDAYEHQESAPPPDESDPNAFVEIPF